MSYRIFRHTLLLIIPIFLFIFTRSRMISGGQYFLAFGYDPVYAYLIGSLNLSQFYGTTFVFHPGISLQIIGAVVIRIYFLFKGNNSDIVEDVLTRPESYLFAIEILLIVISCIALLILGIVVFQSTKNIFASILVQLAPFISSTSSGQLSTVTPDNLLMPIILVLFAISIKFIYHDKTIKHYKYLFEILFGIICGIGLATKLSFLPVMIIPIILIKGMRRKVLFLIFTLIVFLIMFSPGISNYNALLDWIKSLFIYSGQYGSGDSNIVDTATFLKNLKDIFTTEKLFSYSYCLIFISIIILFKYFRKKINENEYPEYKLLFSIFLAITFQIIISAKQYTGRYLIPALILSIPGIYLAIFLISKTFNVKFKALIFNLIYSLLIIYFFSNTIVESIKINKWSVIQRNEAIKISNYVKENCSNSKLLTVYGSSSEAYALAFAAGYAGSRRWKYRIILDKLYPNQYFFESWTKNVYSFSRKPLFSDEKVFLQFKSYNFNATILANLEKNLKETYSIPNLEFIKLFSNSVGESIYEIKIK